MFSQPIRVRLYGIDAPEARQKFGLTSHAALGPSPRNRGGELCDGGVRLRPVRPGCWAALLAGHHGRGRSINLAMVRQGYAYCLRHARGEYGPAGAGVSWRRSRMPDGSVWGSGLRR